MGGQLIKGYALEGDSQGPAGLTKAWKLYRGHKAQTHALASIFLIEKKQLKKAEKEESIRVAKKEASSLARVRHPGVLAVVEPLTEDENILAFVAERVEGSMGQLVRSGKMADFLNSELQLKLYLYPFLETIMFIHDTLKQAHLAISPQHIYIAPDGKWKLAGFGLNQQLTGEGEQKAEQKLADYSFAAPELALSATFTKKSDIFSLGVLIVRIMEFIHKEHKQITVTDKNQFQKYSPELNKLANSGVVSKSSHAAQLRELLGGMLSWQGNLRWEISQVLSSKWMNDSTLITVKYLDKISSYENKQQLEFLKGLAGVLQDFDARVLARIVLPKLIDLLKFGHLIASVAYIIIDLLKKGRLSSDLFGKVGWPALKSVMQGKEMTAQAIYLFVLNYEILEKHIGEADTVTYLLPLYIKCFDCPPKLKQLALRGIERLSKKLDYQNFKTRVVPKLLGLLKDPVIDIRKDALRALYAILRVIDAQTMSLSVLPAIEAARKAGSDGFVNAIINAIYNHLATTLPSDVLSSKILPTLIPYLSEASISRAEFHQFKQTIIHMISIIEKEREKSFGNSIAAEEAAFTEADFKFKEEEKPQAEVKGNYSFLANYIESKPDNIANSNISPQPQSNAAQNIPTNISPTNNSNQLPPTLHFPLSANQDFSFGAAYTPPVVSGAKKQVIDDMTTINYPMPSIEIKPAVSPNLSFNIKPTIPDPAPVSVTYDFEGLNHYQPLDMKFAQDSPSFPFTPAPKTDKQSIKQANPNHKAPSQAPSLQSKPSDQEKKNGKQSKFVGGASGPMEIKKTVGPQSKIKPPPKQDSPTTKPTHNFNTDSLPTHKPQPLNYTMDFGNLGLDMNFNQRSSMKPEPIIANSMPFNFAGPSIKPTTPADPNNPFAEIESGFNKPIVGSNAMRSLGKEGNKNDIYSYFQEQENKPKGGNSMDLI